MSVVQGALITLLRAFGALLVAVVILSGGCWAEQTSMPFNSEGRYFDPDAEIVHEDFRDVFASLAVASAVLACGAFAGARLLARDSGRRQSRSPHIPT